jgi:hypothetical protein
MIRLSIEPTDVAENRAGIDRLAAALEDQCAALYRDLAAKAARFGREEAARAFLRIEQLSRAPAAGESPAGRPAGHDLRTPVLDSEGLGENRNVAPYDAWALAVRNSERAFAFWTYLSAYTQDPAAAQAAERLAEAASSLARRFRAERRRAYHAGRSERPQLLPVGTPDAFAAAAAREEAALSALHRATARRLADLGHPLAGRLAGIAEREAESAGIPPPGGAEPVLPERAEDLLQLAQARLQTALDLYLRAAEAARDERTMAHAQRLSEATLEAIAALDEGGPGPAAPAPPPA